MKRGIEQIQKENIKSRRKAAITKKYGNGKSQDGSRKH